eukprot:TRINITY_DN2031_c1_g2_i1.p1 TRINITY_DN2031_c1_g2~~TRINITY_DN2031_c1_g2_i1.p1  ORF type:complete len:271 (+),score=92.83 TRINITY_DN2031_c1_g2_i1:202-1014(+)
MHEETHRFEVGDRRARGDHSQRKLRAGGITWRRVGAGVASGRIKRLEDIEVVLVQSRTSPDRWILPGGTVENGETAIEAGLREIEEECGVTPQRNPEGSPMLTRSPLPSPLLAPLGSQSPKTNPAPDPKEAEVVVAVVKPGPSADYAVVPSQSSEQVAGRTLHVVNGTSFIDVVFLGRFFDESKNAESYMFAFEIGHVADTWIEQPHMDRRFLNGALVRDALAWRPAALEIWDTFERNLLTGRRPDSQASASASASAPASASVADKAPLP